MIKNAKNKSTGQAIKLPDRCFAYRNLFYEHPALGWRFFFYLSGFEPMFLLTNTMALHIMNI